MGGLQSATLACRRPCVWFIDELIDGINQLGTFHDRCVGGAHRQSSCRSFRGGSDLAQTGGRHVIPHVIKQLSRHVIASRLPLMKQYTSQLHPL